MYPLVLVLTGCTPEPAPPAAPAPEPAPLAPAWDPSACAPPAPDQTLEPVPDDVLKHARASVPDLDGDQQPETFTVKQVAGDGYADLTLTLTPTAGEPVTVTARFDYGNLVHEVVIPEVLRSDEARRLPFDQELLRTRCPTVDPVVRWLDREPRSLEWVTGPVVVPGVYGVVDGERWRVVAGQALSFDPNGPGFPRVVATEGEVDLVQLAHGVALHDRARGAHSWVWLTPHADRPLKTPTVASARFDGDRVVIAPADSRQGAGSEVVVDRHTGVILGSDTSNAADPR